MFGKRVIYPPIFPGKSVEEAVPHLEAFRRTIESTPFITRKRRRLGTGFACNERVAEKPKKFLLELMEKYVQNTRLPLKGEKIMNNLFRLVFISSAIYCLIQFPLFSWANDVVKVKPRGNTTIKKGVTKSAKPDVVVRKINFSPASLASSPEVFES